MSSMKNEIQPRCMSCSFYLSSVRTSVCMFGTDPVLPLAMAELELLGLLGPEPGALLQREETEGETHRETESERKRH